MQRYDAENKSYLKDTYFLYTRSVKLEICNNSFNHTKGFSVISVCQI